MRLPATLSDGGVLSRGRRDNRTKRCGPKGKVRRQSGESPARDGSGRLRLAEEGLATTVYRAMSRSDPEETIADRAETAGKRGAERRAMVAEQLAARGIGDARVLAAMEVVPRHRFVPASLSAEAYADEPLPIGHGQTISQPYIVALMTQLLAAAPGDRVLEIGTGCGYQTAVLASLVREVCTVEIVAALAQRAEATLAELGVANVVGRVGDGRRGWPERAPFNGIIVTAAPRVLEPVWGEQLADGGRIIVPLGGRYEQWLHRFIKRGPTLYDERLLAVRFVPLIGGTTDADGVG